MVNRKVLTVNGSVVQRFKIYHLIWRKNFIHTSKLKIELKIPKKLYDTTIASELKMFDPQKGRPSLMYFPIWVSDLRPFQKRGAVIRDCKCTDVLYFLNVLPYQHMSWWSSGTYLEFEFIKQEAHRRACHRGTLSCSPKGSLGRTIMDASGRD